MTAVRTVGDAALAVHDTPFGVLEAVAAEGRLRSLRFCWDVPPGRPHGADPALAALGAQLGAYLAGEPVDFELPIEWERVEGLRRDVLQAICAVGHGCTTTYGAVAGRVGRPGEARAVGQALKRNPWVLVVPCHRVVAGTGALTGYAGGPTTGGHLDVKAALLAHEREWAEPTLFGGG